MNRYEQFCENNKLSKATDSINIITENLKAHNLGLFVGSGLSNSCGYLDWKSILQSIAEEIDLDVNKEAGDLVSLAQYYINDKKNAGRSRIETYIRERLKDAKHTDIHEIITELPFHSIWTTNYDSLLEDIYERLCGKGYATVIDTDSALFSYEKNSPVTIYKLHGSVNNMDQDLVVSTEDYETYSNKHGGFLSALRSELILRPFIFIGYSFADPNINYIMRSLKHIMSGKTREHFLFIMKLKPPEDEAIQDPDFEYRQIKEYHRLNHLRENYGITPIVIEDELELRRLFEKFRINKRKGNVVLCGSGRDVKTEELCEKLGYEIVKNKYQLFTCFAEGVGRSAVAGALKYFGKEGELMPYKKLRIWPTNVDEGTGEPVLTSERNSMIHKTNSCIFVGGAKGTINEFEIATEKSKFCIPVGYTGGAAEVAHQIVMKNIEKYTDEYELTREEIETINTDLDKLASKQDADTTVEIVLRMLAIVSK